LLLLLGAWQPAPSAVLDSLASSQPGGRGPSARRGTVRLDRRAFADANGPFLAVGASLFWAVWGFQHDRQRLKAHFDYLAARGVDYVRVLGAVGPTGWTQRTADPSASGYDAAIAGVTDLAHASGLRVEWTIFGGLDRTPTPESRRRLVERFAAMAKGREAAIQHWEIANEAWATGWNGREEEARQLCRLLQGMVPQPVAVTAEGCGAVYYAGGAGTLRTAHLDRDVSGIGGRWGPVWRSWEMSSCEPPRAWTSNEPIGPGSSVASDDDPLRLTMTAAVVWLSGGAGYVLHTRPGVRGGGREDVEQYGGPTSIWDAPHIEAILSGIRAVRGLLPPELPNWRPTECTAGPPGQPLRCEGARRTFCASSDAETICLPLAIDGAFRLSSGSPIHAEWFDPLTGKKLGSSEVSGSRELSIGGREALVIKMRR
jgi:hypothetical protein